MSLRLAILALIAGLLSPHAALADDGRWTLDVGAVARVRPDHIGSGHSMLDWAPVIAGTWGDRVSGSFDDGVKWAAFRHGVTEIGAVAEYRQSFNDRLPVGVKRPGDAVEIGAYVQRRLKFGILDARVRRAVNSYAGWSGDLSFSTGAHLTERTEGGGQVRLGWVDRRFTRQIFGPLAPGSAAPFVTIGAELDGAHRLTNRTKLVIALADDHIIGPLPASGLVRSRDITTISVGLTYRFSGPTHRISTQ